MKGDRLGSATASLTNRGLLRAVLAGFVLFLAYRFLAAVFATVLLLAVGLLLTMALSAPVEMLHRRKVPRPVSILLIVVFLLVLAGLGGHLLLPTLVRETSLLAFSLPDAVSQLIGHARELARSLGVKIGGETAPPRRPWPASRLSLTSLRRRPRRSSKPTPVIICTSCPRTAIDVQRQISVGRLSTRVANADSVWRRTFGSSPVLTRVLDDQAAGARSIAVGLQRGNVGREWV